jgi:hypothetical protein
MEVEKKYPIVSAERFNSKFRPTVLLHVKENPSKIVKLYLPKQYSSVVSDDNIEHINSQKVSLNSIYKGTCERTLSFILAIE